MAAKSFSLKRKLYLSFGVILMMGALVAALLVIMMMRSTSSYKHVLETDSRVAELALVVNADTLRISESLRGRLLHPYGEVGTQELANLAAADADLDEAYSSMRKLASDPEIIAALDGLEDIDNTSLDPLETQILNAIERQESAEAERIYFDSYVQARTHQQDLLDRLNQLASERVAASAGQTTAQSKIVSGVAVALTLILVVAGCVLGYYLTRSFERPISQLMSAARAIAAGDLNKKLSLHRNGELGEMAEVLNTMVTNLRGLNSNLADQVRWLREARDELAQTQGQLVQQEKMAALGQLVAGVAHELNNPISFVYSNTILLRDSVASLQRLCGLYDSCDQMPEEIRTRVNDLKDDIDYDFLSADISTAIEDCHEGARRVRDIVMNLRTFSRLDDSELAPTDISEGIESTARILGQYFRPDRVVLHREYGELPRLDAYAGQLAQVWMNLMVNAAQAMNQKGNLWVTTNLEGDRAIIQFRDDGPGIPPESIGKVFDPFYTTKAVGEGTGLGLSIVHSIIRRHGGEIRVESQVGAGTTFIVVLPVTMGSYVDNASQASESQQAVAEPV
jgi:signal transduction histidine kinase